MKKKLIYLDAEKIKELFLEQLEKTTFYGTSDLVLKVSSVDTVPKDLVDPKIYITAMAFCKMQTLIQKCDKEIAWHGLVRHSGRNYTIYDILVYPQTVTAATATSIDDDYPIWISKLEDKEINNMRMQGHSHVNMGVTPSGVDEQYYRDLLAHVTDYYIVMVLNKRNDATVRLYDVANNVLYEDLSYELILDGRPATSWYDSAAENVHTHVPATQLSLAQHYDLQNYKNRWKDSKKYMEDYYGSDLTQFDEPTKIKGGKNKHESQQTSKFFRSDKH